MNADYARECLSYDPFTGELHWRVRPRSHFSSDRGHAVTNAQRAGTIAGTVTPRGHIAVRIGAQIYKAHRLIWLMQTGEWPSMDVDHEDTNPGNNKWSNLREATDSNNQHNRGLSKANTSGAKGVCWERRLTKWSARIMVNRKTIFLGHFTNLEAAADAYAAAAKRYAGEFARSAVKGETQCTR